jgi:beta-glucosidase
MKTSTFLLGLVASAAADKTPLYKNPKASTDDRVSDLLKRMTIEEKTAQLIQGDFSNFYNTSSGAFNQTGLEWVMKYRASQFYVYASNWTLISSGIKVAQDYLLHNTSLGIPALVQTEGIHGLLIPNATIFNSPIGQGSSWNPALVEKMAKIIGKESAAVGFNQIFGPLGDLARVKSPSP